MSIGQNKANADRFVNEVINQGDLDRADEFFARNFIEHAAPPGFPPGSEGLKQFLRSFRAAFPDLCYTIADTVAEGATVAQRLTGHGTMRGSFLGMPATGKSASWEELHIARVDPSGKFVEHWANVDQLGMLTQLGLGPMPGGH
jgi:predicted ester cyclase